MSIEIQMLAYTGLVLLLLTLAQGARNVLILGLPTAAGNQHDLAPWTGANDRLNRAVRNAIEALSIFAPVIVAVEFEGANNAMSALGAQIFFFARLVHGPIYVAGIPYLRTVAWAAGVIGTLMVALALF
ncbi:MAG: membrane protein [Nitrosomonas sp.]|nr:MAG: membrane protein [Nitrosomonas sp.]